MKNSNDTIWNRIRDLPTCSAVLQPTALPRAPITLKTMQNFVTSPDHLSLQWHAKVTINTVNLSYT